MIGSAISQSYRVSGEISGIDRTEDASVSRPASGGDPADDISDDISIAAIGQLLDELPVEARTAAEDFLSQFAEYGKEGVGLAKAARSRDLLPGLDRVLNLNEGGLGALPVTLGSMSREEAEGFLQSLAKLLRHGVVGYEVRKVNGIPQKMFISAAIGSDFHRAPLVRSGRIDTLV